MTKAKRDRDEGRQIPPGLLPLVKGVLWEGWPRRLLLKLGRHKRSVTEWAKQLGVPVTRLYGRLELGWNAERTLTTPRISPRSGFPACGHADCEEHPGLAADCYEAERKRLVALAKK